MHQHPIKKEIDYKKKWALKVITLQHVDNVSVYFLFSNICAGNKMN